MPFLGWLSDLKIGDKKVTLNHLDLPFTVSFPSLFSGLFVGWLHCFNSIGGVHDLLYRFFLFFGFFLSFFLSFFLESTMDSQKENTNHAFFLSLDFFFRVV